MNLANENLPDEDAPGHFVLAVHEPQPLYDTPGVQFVKDGRPTGRGFNGIMAHLGLKRVQMAGYVLVALTDPNEEPPYIYRFFKNRAGWSPEAIIEYSAFFQRFFSMATDSRLEEVVRDGHLVSPDTSYGTVNLVMNCKSDLVLFRLMHA